MRTSCQYIIKYNKQIETRIFSNKHLKLNKQNQIQNSQWDMKIIFQFYGLNKLDKILLITLRKKQTRKFLAQYSKMINIKNIKMIFQILRHAEKFEDYFPSNYIPIMGIYFRSMSHSLS